MSITVPGFPGVISTIASAVIAAIAAGYNGASGLFTNGPAPTQILVSAASDGNTIMAITSVGKLVKCVDGTNWVGVATQPGFAAGTSIAYGGGYWLATGVALGDIAYSSDGGTTWTKSSAFVTPWSGKTFSGVYYNAIKNKFVVTGTGSKTATFNPATGTFDLTSNLATTGWGTTAAISAYVTNPINGDFIVAGDLGKVAYSQDGATWTYSSGYTTVMGSTGIVDMAISDDGTTIMAATATTRVGKCTVDATYSTWVNMNISQIPTSIGYYHDGVTGYWYLGAASGAVLRCSDNATWEADNSLINSGWSSASLTAMCRIAHGTGNYLYIVGAAMRLCRVSSNTAPWVNLQWPAAATWGNATNGVVMCRNSSTMFAANGSGVIATSADGKNWTPKFTVNSFEALITPTAPTCMVANDTTLIVVVGTRWITVDLATWTISKVNNIAAARSGVWTGVRFVFGTLNGTFWYSADAKNWIQANNPSGWGNTSSYPVYSMGWNGSKVLAVGNGKMCASSVDGVTWSNISTSYSANWGNAGYPYVLAWTGTNWFVGGAYSASMTSTDGVTWVANSGLYYTPWGGATISCSAVVKGRLYVGSNTKLLYYSTNGGLNWTGVNDIGATWGNGNLVAMVDGPDGVAFTGAPTATNDGIGYYKA